MLVFPQPSPDPALTLPLPLHPAITVLIAIQDGLNITPVVVILHNRKHRKDKQNLQSSHLSIIIVLFGEDIICYEFISSLYKLNIYFS